MPMTDDRENFPKLRRSEFTDALPNCSFILPVRISAFLSFGVLSFSAFRGARTVEGIGSGAFGFSDLCRRTWSRVGKLVRLTAGRAGIESTFLPESRGARCRFRCDCGCSGFKMRVSVLDVRGDLACGVIANKGVTRAEQ